MKRLLKSSMLIIPLAFFIFLGCKKDTFTKEEIISNSEPIAESSVWEHSYGFLIFDTYDEFEKTNNEEQLEKYPIYLENRSKIFELAQELENYEKQKENLETLQRELNILNQKKSSLISKENKEEIIQFENELKNINRIKID